MTLLPPRKIAPCPLSKRNYIDEDHAWQSLTVFFLYRLTMGSTLVFLFVLGALPASLGQFLPELYIETASLYLVSLFASAVPMFLRRPSFSLQAQLHILTDIVLIPFIMHASGGVSSGMGIMLALTVAAGGLLIGGRCALAFAALASAAILAEEWYSYVHHLFQQTHFTYSGMLGASYFAIALLALVLARRAERSEAIAEQRGTDITNLEQVNAFIIQNLQSGILVVDEKEYIRLFNESAIRLLSSPIDSLTLSEVCPPLRQQFHHWLLGGNQETATLKLQRTFTLQVTFTRLGLTHPPLYMLFLEDAAFYNERVQQGKLASLGRLTASIAHEVRNPLSAINHASQLLTECPSLEGRDRRLLQIILDHVRRVNTVIENVLQISRREQARRETILLKETVSQFLQDYHVEHGLSINQFQLEPNSEEIKVSVDRTHLKQILENLCANAMKYGYPEKGAIYLRVIKRHGKACCEIQDHAPPIDPSVVQNLFEPFFTTSSSGGTGLGLYIARELAELNQAQLEYIPMVQGGCFRLCLTDTEKFILERQRKENE